MKIKVIVLLMILFMPFFCYAEECKKTDIKIEKVELSEVSGNAEETSTASNDHNQIHLNTKMNVVGDTASYKIVLKRTIEIVANFFYNLVADKLIPKEKEKEIHQILGNDYKPYKEKSKDDDLSL